MLNKKVITTLIIVISLLVLCVLVIFLQLRKIETEIFDNNQVVTLTKKSDLYYLYENNKDLFNRVQQFIDREYEEYKFKSIHLPIDYSNDIIDEYDIYPRDNPNISELVNELRTNSDIIHLSSELKINYIEVINLGKDTFFL